MIVAEPTVQTENYNVHKNTLGNIEVIKEQVDGYFSRITDISNHICLIKPEGTQDLLETVNSNVLDLQYLITEKFKEFLDNSELSLFINRYDP